MIGWRYFGRAEQKKAGSVFFDPGNNVDHPLLLFGVGCFTNGPDTPGEDDTDHHKDTDSDADDHPHTIHHAHAFTYADCLPNLDSLANSDGNTNFHKHPNPDRFACPNEYTDRSYTDAD